MKNLAYIPARGGSKGIIKKNIVDLNGEPLLAYTIRSAKESGLFDMIFVSTDSEEIAEVAKKWGADVPFLRYAEFAQDTSKTIDAVYSDKCRLEAMGRKFDSLSVLQATSPFRTADDIKGAMEQLGINNSELAKRMKVSRPYITKVLSGDVSFTFRTAAKLAHALKMDFFPELRGKDVKVKMKVKSKKGGANFLAENFVRA